MEAPKNPLNPPADRQAALVDALAIPLFNVFNHEAATLLDICAARVLGRLMILYHEGETDKLCAVANAMDEFIGQEADPEWPNVIGAEDEEDKS
jgi:hypothetical protein